VALASSAVFVFVLAEVYLGHLSWLDRAVNEMISPQSPWIVLLWKGLHFLFAPLSVIVMTVAMALIVWRKTGQKEAVLIAGMMLLGTAVSHLVKLLVARPRPENALIALSDPAFPSGHASATAIFFGILCMMLVPRLKPGLRRITVISCSVFMVALVGFSRLCLHVHWLTDVVAGLALGGAVTCAGVLAQDFFSTAKPTEASDHRDSEPHGAHTNDGSRIG
jgi:membrane-associated phospholipid phosphatase